MARLYGWTDEWRDARLVCPACGWRGKLTLKETTAYQALLEFCCPSCDEILAIVSYPTADEAARRADPGSDREH